MSAVYDSSKYYKNELKKQDTMESVIIEDEVMDSDDEDDHGPLPTRPNFSLQVKVIVYFLFFTVFKLSNKAKPKHRNMFSVHLHLSLDYPYKVNLCISCIHFL